MQDNCRQYGCDQSNGFKKFGYSSFGFVTGLLLYCSVALGQDTMSIVAVDPETGDVGSAAASCTDIAVEYPGYPTDFVGQLFPGLGVINTQALYNPSNQFIARERMLAGDTPQEIVQWMIDHDVNFRSDLRQYGVAAIIDGQAQASAFTGTAIDDIKGHIIGPNYAIQGNNLSDLEILNRMEENFLNTSGELGEKLMSALQGANSEGADERCASNGTSSLFAFIKVAYSDDEFRDPSFVLSVRTNPGEMKEPIDSLQTLFDRRYRRRIVSVEDDLSSENKIKVYPNPFAQEITIELANKNGFNLEIRSISGKHVYSAQFDSQRTIDTSNLRAGLYIIHLYNEVDAIRLPVIKL